MTVTATKIDSSHKAAKFHNWVWPASTTIMYNNPVEQLSALNP
jgi:hypothetical protein